MEEYKRLKRELIHKGKIIDYYCDYMQIPNGTVAEWDFINHKGAAAIVPVDSDGNIIMVRQYRNALERYTLEIPAGGLNAGETMKECAVRELEEETGYRTKAAEHLIDIYTTVAFCNEKIGIYLAEDLMPGRQHLDSDEFLNVEKHSLTELMELIFTGKIEDSKTVSALLAYKAKRSL
ncbi:NUDIX hydrolase [Anaeromicropila populeti]|uniref:ADP-ribose pyrophosphatase n=1 Tax=Anaeromicropila populeti TaxID=37658 RepID=A0A1I6L5N2_9FIRM|nr:NUDIX hydrolase [Anaeromicropila populeti]SFR98785.1 ADP-ribose pyrophosphatase [Anaeromicropila populeti]